MSRGLFISKSDDRRHNDESTARHPGCYQQADWGSLTEMQVSTCKRSFPLRRYDVTRMLPCQRS